MAYTNLTDLFKGICDAIRAKKGTTGTINHQDIPSEIESIEAGVDVSGVTANTSDVALGKVFVNSNGTEQIGTVAVVEESEYAFCGDDSDCIGETSWQVTGENSNGDDVWIPMTTLTSDKLIRRGGIISFLIKMTRFGTATASDVVNGKTFSSKGGISLTGTMPTKEAQYYTPTTSNQTISSGQYLTGTQTIYGDINLVSSNIKSGTSIFGVTGSYSGGKTYVGETYGTFPEADACYGWADGSYDYLATSSNVIYVPIDSAHVNVVPTSVSILRKNGGTNGLIAALYKGSSNGSGLRMIADDSDEFAINQEGTGYFEFYWHDNNLLINIDEAILNNERYWYAVSYS